jgi:hypothetical protein
MQDPNINNKTNAAGYQISQLYSILFHTSTKQTHTPWPVFKGRKTTQELQSNPSQTPVFTYPDLKQKPQHIIKNISSNSLLIMLAIFFLSHSLSLFAECPYRSFQCLSISLLLPWGPFPHSLPYYSPFSGSSLRLLSLIRVSSATPEQFSVHKL